jgi:hypothetical protein
MTIDEAIGEMKIYLQKDLVTYTPRRAEAVQLGIEALKRLQQLRLSQITSFRGPLPGESEK